MRSEGYGSVCLSVAVCLSTTILALQATRRLMSDTNSVSGTWARKIKWLKRLLHETTVSGIAHAQFAEGLHFHCVRL